MLLSIKEENQCSLNKALCGKICGSGKNKVSFIISTSLSSSPSIYNMFAFSILVQVGSKHLMNNMESLLICIVEGKFSVKQVEDLL